MSTTVIEILAHVVPYIPRYQRPFLRFVSKDFKQIIDEQLLILLDAFPENWEILRTKRNAVGVKFTDFTIPYYLQPLESVELLREITFCRITLAMNLHCILRKCNFIQSLAFSNILIDSDLKYNPANPIVLPNLQTLRLQTGGSQLTKDDEVLFDFLAKIIYGKLEKIFIWYSTPHEHLEELKLYHIWNIHAPAHSASLLIRKNINTLQFFACGRLSAADIFRFHPNTDQLSHLSIKSKYPISLQGLLTQQFQLKYVELNQLAHQLWSPALNLVQNCKETLTHVTLVTAKDETRDPTESLDLAIFKEARKLQRLKIHLNFNRIYEIFSLPKTLEYLSLKGQMTKFELQDIPTHLPNLDYLYLDLEETAPVDGIRTQMCDLNERFLNDDGYMTLTVDIDVLQDLISMPKITKIILKQCIGHHGELLSWCENEEKNKRNIYTVIRALNPEATLGNIDITVFH